MSSDPNTDIYSKAKVVKYYSEYSTALQEPEKTIFELLKHQLPDMRVLDIGVGGGRTTPALAPHAKEYIGIDFSPEMIQVCTEKYKSTYPVAKFEVCDVRNLTHFDTGYFDLILFSFNGLDNITADERELCLKEFRRICSVTGYLCFSSHNIQSLPNFFKVQFRLHPIKLISSIIKRKKLIKENATQLIKMTTADYVIIYDDVYDFGLQTYYVRPSNQIRALNSAGFKNVQLFDLKRGKPLSTSEEYTATTDSWIYYLSK